MATKAEMQALKDSVDHATYHLRRAEEREAKMKEAYELATERNRQYQAEIQHFDPEAVLLSEVSHVIAQFLDRGYRYDSPEYQRGREAVDRVLTHLRQRFFEATPTYDANRMEWR